MAAEELCAASFIAVQHPPNLYDFVDQRLGLWRGEQSAIARRDQVILSLGTGFDRDVQVAGEFPLRRGAAAFDNIRGNRIRGPAQRP